MTDKEKLVKIFNELNIPIENKDDGSIVLDGYGDKNWEGYTGFFVSFTFSDDGRLESYGAFE